jgi:predicted house-cleaning noncanonical NTP pyrophosphatase (MazG superfamily)
MPVPCRKLVRDRIPEIIQSEGRRPVTRMLDEAGYREALLAKLIEEAQEVSHPPPTAFPVSWPTCWKCSAP